MSGGGGGAKGKGSQKTFFFWTSFLPRIPLLVKYINVWAPEQGSLNLKIDNLMAVFESTFCSEPLGDNKKWNFLPLIKKINLIYFVLFFFVDY